MRLLVVTIAFVLAAALLVFTLIRPSKQAAVPKQPQGWNSNAIRGNFAGVQVKEVDPTHAALVFTYDLENSTDSDYGLANGPKVLIMGRLKSSSSLKTEDSMKIDNSIFLPARNRARVALEVSYPFIWPTQMVPGGVGPMTQEKFRSFVAGKVTDLQGFILFDQAARYQIELPGGWQELQPSGAAAGAD
jgi:hypothetical protein